MALERIDSLRPGSMLGHYKILSVLGSGGFGITYLCSDTRLNRIEAIKEYLPNEYAVREGDTTVRARSTDDEKEFEWGLRTFLEEARSLAQFDHPNIVGLRQYFEANGSAYIVMKFQSGFSLEQILHLHPERLTEAHLRALSLQILAGLEATHNVGIFHRDIKPSNIFVNDDGVAVLLDFGSARQSVSDRSQNYTSVLTPGYSPIEQYGSTVPQGPWTDIYAFAATIYRVVSGEKPLSCTDRLLDDAIRPASELGRGRVSDSLLAAIDAGLAVHPKDRPQDIDTWREAFFADNSIAVEPAELRELASLVAEVRALEQLRETSGEELPEGHDYDDDSVTELAGDDVRTRTQFDNDRTVVADQTGDLASSHIATARRTERSRPSSGFGVRTIAIAGLCVLAVVAAAFYLYAPTTERLSESEFRSTAAIPSAPQTTGSDAPAAQSSSTTVGSGKSTSAPARTDDAVLAVTSDSGRNSVETKPVVVSQPAILNPTEPLTARQPGLYAKRNGNPGESLKPDLFESPITNGIGPGDTPTSFEQHVRGTCLSRSISPGERLTWEHIKVVGCI